MNKINQREEGQEKMSPNDYCIVCGAYIPEGYGQVCLNCLKKYSEIKKEKEEKSKKDKKSS